VTTPVSAAPALGTGPDAVDKTLFQLSYPLLLNAAIGMLVTLIDTMIISAYAAEAAAAVSLANQILLVAFDLSALFGIGAVVMISRHLGRGDVGAARAVATTAIAANLLGSVMLGIALLLAGHWLATAINTPATIYDDTLLYLRVGALSIIFNGVMMAATASLRGFGRTRTIMLLGLAAYALYLIAEYLLIFGFGPVPALGVAGSALATLLVRILAVVALLLVLARQLGLSRAHLPRGTGALKRHVHELFRLSYPAAADNLAYGVYQMILVSFIARYDVVMVLARSFTLALSAFLTLILMALSQGNEVMVGYRFGAGRMGDVYRCAMQSAAVAALLTTVPAVALYLSAEALFGLFTDDAEIIRLGTELLWLTIFVQPVSALNTILFHSLKTMGDVHVPVIATQVMMWGLSLPLAYGLSIILELGVLGLWYVLLIEESLKALFLLYRWSGQFRVDDKPLLAS
jgi:putative MATE family efflux protein